MRLYKLHRFQWDSTPIGATYYANHEDGTMGKARMNDPAVADWNTDFDYNVYLSPTVYKRTFSSLERTLYQNEEVDYEVS